MKVTKKLWSTAYHEAGHAVAVLVYGLPINTITIRETEDSFGHVLKPSPMMFEVGKRKRNQIVRQYIVSSYAGYEAERRFDPERADEGLSQDDLNNAWNLPREWELPIRGCSYIGDEAYERYLDRQQRQARALVTKHWRFVEMLAQALLERETLTGEDVEDLFRKGGMKWQSK